MKQALPHSNVSGSHVLRLYSKKIFVDTSWGTSRKGGLGLDSFLEAQMIWYLSLRTSVVYKIISEPRILEIKSSVYLDMLLCHIHAVQMAAVMYHARCLRKYFAGNMGKLVWQLPWHWKSWYRQPTHIIPNLVKALRSLWRLLLF